MRSIISLFLESGSGYIRRKAFQHIHDGGGWVWGSGGGSRKWALVPWNDGFSHCLCAHNTFFKMISVNNRSREKWVLEQFSVTLHSLETSAIVGRLSINYVFRYTVLKLSRFDLVFTIDWHQIVMRLQSWHQPLTTLKRNTERLAFFLSWNGVRCSSVSICVTQPGSIVE